MAFTKIAAAGIGSTETVTLHSLEVLNNATVGGVLTYEDVTNVDQIGIVTARAGVLVGSGITLSKDGDVFFTGIATGNGSGLTALNASNISSGTVPTARLGSGTASSSTFLAGDSTFKTVTGTTINNNADNRLITGSGTANTLEGEANITFDGTNLDLGDDKKIRLGASSDLHIYHDGSNSYLYQDGTGELRANAATFRVMDRNGGETQILASQNGAVNLYYDNDAKIGTGSVGVYAKSIMPSSHETYDLGQNMGRWNDIYIADGGKLKIGQDNDLQIFHDGSDGTIDNNTGTLYIKSNTYLTLMVNNTENAIQAQANGAVELYHNNDIKFMTQSDGVRVEDGGRLYFRNGSENASSAIQNNAGSGNSNLEFRTGGTHRCTINSSGHFEPALNNTYDLGSTSLSWRNIYTNDLNLSNKGSTNSVDGTWGDYTIQEGESDLFLINNRSGKKYKFNLTEVS